MEGKNSVKVILWFLKTYPSFKKKKKDIFNNTVYWHRFFSIGIGSLTLCFKKLKSLLSVSKPSFSLEPTFIFIYLVFFFNSTKVKPTDIW